MNDFCFDTEAPALPRCFTHTYRAALALAYVPVGCVPAAMASFMTNKNGLIRHNPNPIADDAAARRTCAGRNQGVWNLVWNRCAQHAADWVCQSWPSRGH
jgi:hypothetical protein